MTGEAYLHVEYAAFAKLAAIRWPDGPVCPRCRRRERIRRPSQRAKKLRNLTCRSCGAHFSVTAGTIFQGCHVPLHNWLLACKLVAETDAKAAELCSTLKVTYKTARRMKRLIKAALGSDPAPDFDAALRVILSEPSRSPLTAATGAARLRYARKLTAGAGDETAKTLSGEPARGGAAGHRLLHVWSGLVHRLLRVLTGLVGRLLLIVPSGVARGRGRGDKRRSEEAGQCAGRQDDDSHPHPLDLETGHS
jgi:transposase-like protein